MKIVAVDDNKGSLYLLETMLRDSGYDVVTAGNGIEALERLRESPVSMIISDILMPGMDGYRLCNECKDDEKLRHIPFIFYTAACMDSKDEEFAFSLGADRFLIKPVEPVLLAEMIKDVLNEHADRSAAGGAAQLSEADLHLKEYNEFLVRKLEKKTMDLENEIAERKSLERAVVEIEERERQRIGYELHDGLGQLLTAVLFKNRYLERKLEKTCVSGAEELAEISDLIHEAKEQVSCLAKGLSPVEMDSQGLMSALESLAVCTKKMFGVPCRFLYEKPVSVNNKTAIMQLYRIAQEAVTNAVKHAHPAGVEISLTRRYGHLTMIITDDGRGIPAGNGQARGMGLKIMRHRAGIINGIFDVRPNPGGGTVVECVFQDRISRDARSLFPPVYPVLRVPMTP